MSEYHFGEFVLDTGKRTLSRADSPVSLTPKAFDVGHLDQSAADSKKALDLNPDSWASPINLSRIYLLQGRPQDALSQIEHVHYPPYRAQFLALAYYAFGRERDSDAALNELITKYNASDAFEIATIYAFRDRIDEAFEWLERLMLNGIPV
jgi:tetratricopeptide (TPR) repeat protein